MSQPMLLPDLAGLPIGPLATVFATIAPVFLVIAAGYVAGRMRYLSETASRVLVEFAFRIAIPALLFRTMATVDPPQASPFALWGAFFGAIACTWLAATLLSRLVLGRSGQQGAVDALTASFGNLLLLGLPIALSAFGPAAATPMALIFIIEFPLLWLAATVQWQLASGSSAGLATAIAAVGRDLVRNPIILAIAAGVLWRVTVTAQGIGFPEPVDRMLALLGQAAVPSSLFALGLSLAVMQGSGERGTVATLVVVKLVLLPVIAWGLAFHVFALPELWANVVVLFAAMPTGAVAFLFATRYGTAAGTVAAVIATGVGLSVATITLVLYLLQLRAAG